MFEFILDAFFHKPPEKGMKEIFLYEIESKKWKFVAPVTSFCSSFSIYKIWKNRYELNLDLDYKEEEYLIIYKTNSQTRIKPLTKDQFSYFEGMRQGKNLNDLIEKTSISASEIQDFFYFLTSSRIIKN